MRTLVSIAEQWEGFSSVASLLLTNSELLFQLPRLLFHLLFLPVFLHALHDPCLAPLFPVVYDLFLVFLNYFAADLSRWKSLRGDLLSLFCFMTRRQVSCGTTSRLLLCSS